MSAVDWAGIRHALWYGGILSGAIAALLLAVLRLNAEILLNDYPPDIRARYGPMSARTRRQQILVAVLFGVVGLAVVAASLREMLAQGGGTIPFVPAFVHLVVMFSVFNVVDLVLIDWPLVAFAPRFMILPGTEGLTGYKDYWFHARGFLIGTPLIVVGSAVLAAALAAIF